MRGPEDLILIKATLSSIISLDRERITEDPAWAAIADNVDLNDPEQVEQALYLYLTSYIHRQQLFGEQIFMPSTNGPVDIEVIKMEVDNADGNSNTERGDT
jgi:hypothetical protein